MPSLSIIPQPVRLEPKAGTFELKAGTPVYAEGEAAGAAALFCQWINPASGFNLAASAAPGKGGVSFRLDPALAGLESEGYRLSVKPQGVEARAAQPAGLVHAVQTLRQLLPAEIYSPTKVSGVAWNVPCVEIEDFPRFAWRGAMLDVGRHFFPKADVLRFIDLLALHKLNTFHWHLTEDQGWRIEIREYPRLTEVGAWRKETLVGHMHNEEQADLTFDGRPHGGFYTQADVREVVAFARARGVNVVPEIEMPGHAQAAVAAYPELGNTAEKVEVSTRWGIHEDVYNVEESTLAFLQDVLDEVLELFPSPFIHIGGDECPKKQWRESPRAQARMRELGLKDEDELQSYFVRRMDAFLTSHGRRLVGWDEILEGGLAPNATVMSWRGESGGIAASMAGHDVVMAANTYTYLDYYQSLDTANEPLTIGGYVPLEKVYGYEPVAEGIDPEHAHHVLGAQGQLWTEYMADRAAVDYMAYPRLCALSEVTWSPRAGKDYAAFLARLKEHAGRLDGLGVKYRRWN